MSTVLDISITSEKESPTRPKRLSLCQDLEDFDSPCGGHLSNSLPEIDSNTDTDSKVISPIDNPFIEAGPEPFSEIENKEEEKEEPEKDEDYSNSSPKTITLIEDELLFSKESLSVSTKLGEYSAGVSNESFASFLSVRDSNYNNVIKSFELLFENVSKLFSERMEKILKTYLAFFKIKCKQEKAYIGTTYNNRYPNLNHPIFKNCDSVASEINKSIEKQQSKRGEYVSIIEDIESKLSKHLENMTDIFKEKQTRIADIHKKIQEVDQEMSDLMLLNGKKSKMEVGNIKLHSNSFMRTKFLMKKENSYLILISTFLEKILKFVSFVCFEMEPKNCLIIKESMLHYTDALEDLADSSPHAKLSLERLENLNCYSEIYKEISKLLEICIPESIHNANLKTQEVLYNGEYLKKTIEALINESQSLVYIPVIELDDKDFVYHSKNKAEIKWKKVNNGFKYKEDSIEENDAYIIITKEGHLVLELIDSKEKGEEKMAVLKLSEIKVSQKKSEVVLSDRGNGMMGYLLSSNTVLGVLSFKPLSGVKSEATNENELICEFIEKIKEVLQNKKDQKQFGGSAE